jgi:hypothetical protein
MRIYKLILLLLFISLSFPSCEDETFGPRSFAGIWNATEYDDDSNEITFAVVINDMDGDMVLIGNFSNLGPGYTVEAGISDLELTISSQVIDGVGGTFRVSGNGTATSNLRRINWNYKIDNASYTAVFEKQ